jgi:hypothetical protein
MFGWIRREAPQRIVDGGECAGHRRNALVEVIDLPVRHERIKVYRSTHTRTLGIVTATEAEPVVVKRAASSAPAE